MTKHKKRVSGELRQICPAIWIPVNEKGGNSGGKVVSVGPSSLVNEKDGSSIGVEVPPGVEVVAAGEIVDKFLGTRSPQ